MKPKQNFSKSLLVFLASVIFSLTTHPSYTQQFYRNQYAVVVGINDYMNNNFKDLSYARSDAYAMETLLKQLGFTVYSLYDRQAIRTNIISLLEDRLAPRLANNDAVLFFFAGHGTTIELGGKDWGYIIPSDGTEQLATYISMDQLRTLSEKMGNAKHQAFIMDCCYGGQLAMRNIVPVVSNNIPNYLNEVSKRICRQILTAGGKNQVVADGGYRGHSVFTGYLLKAIDEGMADFNKDGWITFNELTTFLIPAASSSIQTPGYATLPGHEEGEFLFRSDKTFVSKDPTESDRLPAVESETKEFGTIRLCSYSSGDVYIDGKYVGHVEYDDVTDYYNLPIGEHDIEIKDGDQIGKRGVIVAKDKISQVSIQFEIDEGNFSRNNANERKPSQEFIPPPVVKNEPPSAQQRQTAEKLASDWIAAVMNKDLNAIVNLVSMPFYFDNEIIVRTEDLLNEYKKLFEARGDLVPKTKIERFKTRTIAEFKQEGNANTDRVLTSLSLTDSDFSVEMIFSIEGRSGTESILFFMRMVDGKLKMAGSWD